MKQFDGQLFDVYWFPSMTFAMVEANQNRSIVLYTPRIPAVVNINCHSLFPTSSIPANLEPDLYCRLELLLI